MQAHLSSEPASVARDLLWVLSPSGWALGRIWQDQPVLDQSWPQGDPPIDCPAPDLAWALRQALGTPVEVDQDLHLLVCACAPQNRPPWWPDTRWRLRPWRELARDTRLRLASVRVMADELGATSLWEGAGLAWRQAQPLRGIEGWAAWVPHRPGPAFGASAVAMVGLHLLLTTVLRPWLLDHQRVLQSEAAQAHQSMLAQQTLERNQARELERQSRLRAWQQRQHEALAPLQQWMELVDQVERTESPQWWGEMRWAQDAWTVWGHASHEALGDDGPFGATASGRIERIESVPTVWPPAPQWGFPAWRYQVRVQAPQGERLPRTEGAP